MSSVQSKIARLAKKQENITHVERNQLIETDQEMAQILDLKYKDMSAIITKKCKVLMENVNLVVQEIRESLKNDLKEILEVKSTVSEVRNAKNSSTRKEWQQIKDVASQKTGLVEKTRERSKVVKDTEILTFKRKKVNELSGKLHKAKEYNANQGKELAWNESQNCEVMGSMEEPISNTDDRYRKCNIRTEVTGENGVDELVQEMREEKVPQNLKNKEKILKASREDEGAILRLVADFSSATLDINKQWSNTFNILRENDFEPKLICQFKLAFKCDGEIRTFSDMESLSKFTSQKSFMKEILKDVLPQNGKIKKEGRKHEIQEKVDKIPIDSKCGAGGPTSDGLSFLFIKEVKVDEPEEVKNLEIQEKASSEWKEKEILKVEEASELEDEGADISGLEGEEDPSELEGEEGASELEEEEEERASGLEEEEEEEEGASELEEEEEGASELEEEEEEGASELEEEEEGASGLEEEEGASELEEEEGEGASGLEEEEEEGASELEEEEGEGASGLEEEEEASVLCEEQYSTFQNHTVVNTKHGVEITSDSLEVILIKEGEDSEPEEDDSEWEMEVLLPWEEEEDSEVEKVKTTTQTEKKEASYGLKEIAFSCLSSDSEKKLVKYQVSPKKQNKEETATAGNQGIGTVSPKLKSSKSLEISSDKQKRHSYTNVNTPSGITKLLRKTEKKKYTTLHAKALTCKETDLTKETEENFRRNVINSFREIQREIRNIKNFYPEILEVKNSVDTLSSRIDMLEERMNNLEDQIEDFSEDTMQMVKQIIKKERLRDTEDRSRSSNIRLIGIPEKDNNENGAEEIIEEIIEENFPELKKESSLKIVSAYRIPSKIDEKRLTPRHILVKFWNSSDKEKIMKASRERKEITYQGTKIRLTADLSLFTLDARSKWGNIIRVLQAKGFKPRMLYPAKLSFDFEGKAKTFFDIEEFRKFVSCVPSLRELQDILK